MTHLLTQNVALNNDKIKYFISSSLRTYSKEEVLSFIVRSFLHANNINTTNIKNRYINSVIKVNNTALTQKFKNEMGEDFSFESWNFSYKLLEELFYEYLDEKTKKNNGIFYTPSNISNYINENVMVNVKENSTIVDLSCGNGEFLLSAVKIMKRKFPNKSLVNIIENNIYGVDILEENIQSTKIILTLYILASGEDCEKINFNFLVADSTDPHLITYFNDKNVSNGFDYIVGNPPYVKIQDLSIVQKKMLKESYYSCAQGNYNLFYAFIELSLYYLKENGKIGYIVPNHLLKMKSAHNLRKLLIKNRYIESIIDFKDNQLFDNAQTYSAIIFFDKENKENFTAKIIEGKVTRDNTSNVVNDTPSIKINYGDVRSEAINLLSPTEYENIQKIENNIGNLMLSTGIATQKDFLYLINLDREANKNEEDQYYYKEHDGELYKIEKEITIPIIKGSGEKKIDDKTKFYEFNRIIYPYSIINNKAKIIPEELLKQKYPNAYIYFKAIKAELEKRKGDSTAKKYWYAYGRSQALNSFVPKIIYPTNSASPNFTYFESKALFNNGYAIYGVNNTDNEIELNILTKILNSSIMSYYIKLTSYMISGGYYCYQKKYVENFTIPNFTKQELEYLKQTDNSFEINEFLINKYKLVDVY